MTDEQRRQEEERLIRLGEAHELIAGVRRGVYMREPATRIAIKKLMVASHSGRMGALDYPNNGGLLDV